MEEQFDLSEVVSDATKAQADRDFYLAMATQSKAVSPIAAYLAGAAGAKASTLQGKIQADKDAKQAAEKFTSRRDKLLLNMHSIARDTNTNPATKAGMIGLIAKEIGLTPKNYDAENNVLDVADANGDMYTFDFNEFLGDEAEAKIKKLNAQTGEASARKTYYEKRSIGGGSSTNKQIKLSDVKSDPRFKNILIDATDNTVEDIQAGLNDINENAQRDLFNMLDEGEPKIRVAYKTVYDTLKKKFGSKGTAEETVEETTIF